MSDPGRANSAGAGSGATPGPARSPVRLGRNGPVVTRLGLGTASLASPAVPPEQAHAAIERAWQSGLRLFDTAPMYGLGEAERRTGSVLGQVPRSALVLSTKVGRLILIRPVPLDAAVPPSADPSVTGGLRLQTVFDFSYSAVLRSVEESLERLGLDRVDVLLVHDPDEHYQAARDGAFPALMELRAQGRVAAVGAGMNQAQMLTRFVRELDLDCVLVAGRYTLLDQTAGRELLPLCAERGVGVIIGGVFNSGLLADPRLGATYDYAPADANLVRRAKRLEAICAEHGVPLRAAALQFPLLHPAVTSVLIGPRSAAEVDENVALAELPLPDDLWPALAAAGVSLPATAGRGVLAG